MSDFYVELLPEPMEGRIKESTIRPEDDIVQKLVAHDKENSPDFLKAVLGNFSTENDSVFFHQENSRSDKYVISSVNLEEYLTNPNKLLLTYRTLNYGDTVELKQGLGILVEKLSGRGRDYYAVSLGKNADNWQGGKKLKLEKLTRITKLPILQKEEWVNN
jgi:hypothetical protein